MVSMRVLVTGAAGFIGSFIADALERAGHEVIGFDSLTPAVHNGKPSYIPNGRAFHVGDIRDASAVSSAVSGVDAVCHQAAMVGLGVSLSDLPLYSDVNVTGTAVLLDAMGHHGVSRLVLASSMVVYGEGSYSCGSCGPVRPLPRSVSDLDAGVFEPRCPSCGGLLSTSTVPESAALDPRNAYATSKVAQEHLAANWARLTEGSVVALRYHNVYGPRMPRDTPYSGVAAIFRSCLERGEPPRVFEDGGQMRDFVHVRDVAECNVRALEAVDRAIRADVPTSDAPAAGAPASSGGGGAVPGALRAYNVASGTPHTVGEMAAALAAAFDGGLDPKVTGEYRLGDVRHIVASSRAAASELGFTASVGFADGMAEFARAELRAPVA
jgi:dTDP-L-rhamnose 4-epimerase